MERYRRTGTDVTVEAIQLSEENYDEIGWLFPMAQPAQEQDPLTKEVFRAYNIPTPSGVKRLSQGQYLIKYGGLLEVALPGWFRRNYSPIEIQKGEVPRDVRDEKILRAHEDET